MGIHAKGCTCDKSTKVPVFFDAKIGHIIGQYRFDLVHLISKGFVQDLQIENISNLQLRKIGEHLLTRHAAVGGQNTVGRVTAYRQRTAQQVTDANFEDFRVCSMINGQMDFNGRDLHISHNAITGNIQLMIIVFRRA